jgi:hypothetical protein
MWRHFRQSTQRLFEVKITGVQKSKRLARHGYLRATQMQTVLANDWVV